MAQRISRAQMTVKNPAEWVEGSARATRARRRVAGQVKKLIEDGALTGSQDYVARRVSEYAAAIKSGDPSAQRAALMDLATAAGATAAAIDLQRPHMVA